MTTLIEAWRTDHSYFARLLALLRRQVDDFQSDKEPNYDLMLEIISYLRDYSDQVHHPCEDVAFARMANHCPEMELELSRLAQEHRVIAQAGETLRRLLDAVLGDTLVPKVDIEAAAATYLVYYGRHIAKEDEDVLPRAAQVLTPEDWEAVRNAVPRVRDPLGAEGSDEHYRILRRHIAQES